MSLRDRLERKGRGEELWVSLGVSQREGGPVNLGVEGPDRWGHSKPVRGQEGTTGISSSVPLGFLGSE